MGRVSAASTCWKSALKRGRWPVASRLARAIAAPMMPRMVAEATWSLAA
jgi:hypothetical protein